MEIYLADALQISLDKNLIAGLPEIRQNKLLRFKNADDKKRCLAVGLMIDRHILHRDNSIYKIADNGKPYCENGICFNASHSGKYALLAVDSQELGADIEENLPKNADRIAKHIFHPNELKLLENEKDGKKTTELFFRLWTKKEAFLKYSGIGIRRTLKDIDLSADRFTENGELYYFKTYSLPEYTISVCSKSTDFPQKIKYEVI